MPAVNTELHDDVLVMRFTDPELRDSQRIAEVGEAMVGACDMASAGKILLDFSPVGFITSEMVGQLFMLANRCRARDIRLKACSMVQGIRDVLATVRLLDFLEIYGDRAAALAAFSDTGEDLSASEEFDVDHKVFVRGAAEGDIDAEYELALCYEKGSGVEQDLELSMKWLRRAADHEHPDAQYKLGAAYAYGIQVDQDYDEALKWFRLAADQGQADAQYALGMSYHYGISVDVDEAVATGWYEKAAAQGHQRAAEVMQRLGAESQA